MSIDNKEKSFADARFFIGKDLTPINSKNAFICREGRRGGFLQNTVNGTVHISGARLKKCYENIS